MTNKHKIIVRGNIHMPWSPTDNDLKALNNYYDSPAFLADTNANFFDVLDFAYDQYHMHFKNIRIINSILLTSLIAV